MTVTIKTTTGNDIRISHNKLANLRNQMDWQLEQQGYDPASITAVCMATDEAIERMQTENLMRRLQDRDNEE